MTKHDIRIRRQSFSKGQIERHKDFKKFSGMYEKKRSKNSLSRFLLTLMAIIMLALIAYFGYFRVSEQQKQKKVEEQEVPSTIWDEFEN